MYVRATYNLFQVTLGAFQNPAYYPYNFTSDYITVFYDDLILSESLYLVITHVVKHIVRIPCILRRRTNVESETLCFCKWYDWKSVPLSWFRRRYFQFCASRIWDPKCFQKPWLFPDLILTKRNKQLGRTQWHRNLNTCRHQSVVGTYSDPSFYLNYVRVQSTD